jgi:Tfp pilus assembly protein PilF
MRRLLTLACLSSLALAQCHGPANIENAIKRAPTGEAYSALGAYFAQNNRLDCALSAFENAVKLNPAL